ncbi:TonB-dependent receptor [Ilyomonas limi]|uniref:TonB-dependent receptor n=1 Tax=Ilyomonas limi TaxID=2575867 RepID=A0A4U3L066_9BACT|nr:TonB-dependent receptor [Ilyomonas limi]TKK68318.1 TonB-dependent receptor [Ilyomonas limi]
MKQSALFIAFLLTCFLAQAQVKISGAVKDNRGKKVISASITLKDTYDGATSDSSGNYTFTTTEKGNHILVASAIGYKTVEQTITIANEPLTINFSIKEEINELKAVTVTAGSFAAGDSKRAVTVLNSIDVATVGGGNADITSAIKTLPGAQQVGEQEGLFVRGGAGYETKQFIDGTLVNNPYFSSVPDIASRGRFSPFLFKGTVFSAGGYSALYGQALSSAVILESIDLPEKTAANASISPLFAGAGYQYLNKQKTASYGIDYGYVNVAAYFSLVKQTPDYFKMPQFHNGDANFRFKTKNGGMVKYYTTFGTGNLGIRRPDVDSSVLKDAFSLKNYNWYNNLSWRENLGNGWKMNLGSSFSTNKDKLSQQLQNQNNQPQHFGDDKFWMQYKNFNLDRLEDLSQIKAVFDKKLGNLNAIRFGGEYWHSLNKTTIYDTMYKLIDNYEALFAEGDIYITNNLAAKLGARFEHSSILGKVNLAPRVSLAYKVGNSGSISAAYGIFYQKPENQQLMYTRNLGYTRADHYILNYQKMTEGRIFRVEAFYKKYLDLVKTVPVNYYYTTANNSGSGYAKGIELFWRDKKSFKNLDYWFSYSYLDTKRDYLNYPIQLQPNFAAKHTASLVVKRFITEWKTGIGLTYSFATGRPYYNLRYDGALKPYLIADQGKTKNYNNLGVSIYYVPQAGNTNAKTNVVLFGSVTNVLGYNAVYGYNYSYDGLHKEAITPPAKRFYFIGAFFSWGVNRSEDAINNNL